jgi:hypothetical protein
MTRAATLELTLEGLDEAVRGHELLVIALGSSAENLGSVQPADSRVQLAQVVPHAEPSVAALLGLKEGGALVIFGRQVILYAESGEHSPEGIAALIQRVCALDLDRIQAEIEQERQAQVALRMRRVCPTARRGGQAP